MSEPICYKCVHRMEIPGDMHSRCNNHQAKVVGKEQGIKGGWFTWPVNFDPVWLVSCDGFSDNPEDRKPRQELHPLVELLAMLKS